MSGGCPVLSIIRLLEGVNGVKIGVRVPIEDDRGKPGVASLHPNILSL